MNRLKGLLPYAACLGMASLAGCGGGGGVTSEPVALTVESSKKEYVSGGDALLRVDLKNTTDRQVRIKVNGTTVPVTFATDSSDAMARVGLVTGLAVGENTITAEIVNAGGNLFGSTSVQVRNYPRVGPMFSGPHQAPFICQTDAFRLFPAGPFLGAAKDSNCSADTRVDYVYRNAANTFVALPSLTAVPADAVTVTTTEGRTVPYIVRIETGVVNRSIYQTSLLHNPASEAAPTPTVKAAGWNGRVVYTFGGGCPGGWYRQGSNTGGVLIDQILRQGYAMASSSLNVYGNNCNDVLSSESMAMVKERFIEAYGRPKHVIGWGESGGSYQQYQTADNYPGLLDGILPGASFPEVMHAGAGFMVDSRLIGIYARDVAPGTLTDQQLAAIGGVVTTKTIYNGQNFNGGTRIDPTQNCPAGIPAEQIYNATTNPTGVRCDIYQVVVNAMGKNAAGFAYRTMDNTGVQYGLQALNDGVISVDQFLDLNDRIGGNDGDGKPRAARTLADVQGLRAAYRGGRLTSAGAGLKDLPIIDYRSYRDDQPNGDVHVRFHSFSMRERLRKVNGNSDNFVMMMDDGRYGNYSATSPVLMRALAEMDKWLTAMAKDTAPGTAREKVIRNKPSTLLEGCDNRDATPAFIAEKMERSSGQCAALYPTPAGPRIVAGSNIANDIAKCQLKPVAASDYKVAMTPAQETKLRSVFATGTCNWNVPGVEQQPLAGTWQAY